MLVTVNIISTRPDHKFINQNGYEHLTTQMRSVASSKGWTLIGREAKEISKQFVDISFIFDAEFFDVYPVSRVAKESVGRSVVTSYIKITEE